MRSDTQDVDGPNLDLQHHQYMKALQRHGVYMQEVTGKDAGRLGGQELPPGRRRPPRRRAEPSGSQDPADPPLPHPAPQAQQLTLDPPVAPGGFCRASSSTNARTWSGTGGRPGAAG
jgi:hypothetical protein